ncbi:cysteine proteinase [Hypoxylon rubiginosum]|uniref:Cysteine proteinase n=1 Tax=Hypoxylon rubiginosum TaxID=110542 RepID=A0ACB9Z9I4_9PEZI|nr:cysteine proteinase [Hypoxylon rubiginosum]
MVGNSLLKNLAPVVRMNTLNGSSQSVHLSRSEPPHSRLSPPAKRQKFEDRGTHTQAHFAPLPPDETFDRYTSRKRSHDSISDSHQTSISQPSNAKGHQSIYAKVDEFRHVENFVSPSSSRKRVRPNPPKEQQRMNVDGINLIPLDSPDFIPLGPDSEDSDGEVEVIKRPPEPGVDSQGQQAEQHQQQSIDIIGKRFNQTRSGRIIDKLIDTTNTKRNKPRSTDSSPDELAPKAQDIRGKMPARRPATPSPGVSKRGDLSSTVFASPSTIEVRQARKIIGDRLRISRAVSGQFKYEASKASSAAECFLKVGEISTLLRPADLAGEKMEQYSYCAINLRKVSKISVSQDPDCWIALIERSSDATMSAAPKLLVEFKSRGELQGLIEWATWQQQQKHTFKIDNTAYEHILKKQLNHMIGEAVRSTVIRDNEGDDVKLIEHNRSMQMQAKSTSQSQTSTGRAKRKDLMKPPASMSPPSPKATVVPEEPQRHNPPRISRTTRSTFALIDAPESPKLPEAPEPDGWSVQNKGWEKQWRNSLVFPHHGKSRATVDKDDISRLDEGEFLNDNLLTFYLRYLQHTLEADRPELAKRIYFQNTYFYEKLKSPKAGGGINYDSVKAWTSKVDLFKKDFIIVPINEFTHWWVAIIYNAPKLLPSPSEKEVPDSQTADTVIIEEDPVDSGKVSRASSQSRRPDEPTGVEALAEAHNDVTTHLSRMSIGSPDLSNSETKQTIATDQESHEAEVQLIGKEQDVEEIVDKGDSRADLEQIQPSSCNLADKRAGKRPSGGPRKFNPNQPRIITLDSLALNHSPACRILKQYLVAELKDKKNLEITIGALGMTAKGVPEQTNYCDCGLYLLGYIEEFLKDPDRFVRSLLQREPIAWNLNPSDLRNEIRDLIFKLQKEQQGREDDHKQQKRKTALSKKRKNEDAEQQVVDGSVPVTVTQAEGTVKEGDIIPTPKTKSPTPKSFRPEPEPVTDSKESRHIPGSYPISPTTVRAEAKGSPTTADTNEAEQSETPKFVSPLSVTVSGSSPVRLVVVDDSEASQGQRQEPPHDYSIPKQASLATEIVRKSPQYLQDHDEPYIDPRSEDEAPISSRFFAGRQPGDEMPSARLREQSEQSHIIDISD